MDTVPNLYKLHNHCLDFFLLALARAVLLRLRKPTVTCKNRSVQETATEFVKLCVCV